MKAKRLAGLAACALAVSLTFGCGPKEDWSDPRWIAHEMERGNPQAFQAIEELDEAGQQAMVPALIETYNANQNQREALRALLETPDERALAVFENALQKNDDQIALYGARGLVALGAPDAGEAIAQRLGAVTSSDLLPGFIDAIRPYESDSIAEAVASVMMRPQDRIGGVQTVREGCRLLGAVDEPSDSMLEAIIFGMVNFQVAPMDDAMNVCEAAALQHEEAITPMLVALYNGENERANAHLRSINMSIAAGQLRAALVLAHMKNDDANDAIRAYFRQDHVIPTRELADMSLEEQQNWYNNNGQVFDFSARALAYVRNENDRELLRSLLDMDGELGNFSSWFTLSEGAEIGLRQAAITALVTIANDGDRSMLWEVATDGETDRGGERTQTLYHVNTMHLLGRIAKAGDLARFQRAMAQQPERFLNEIRPLAGYFVAGELCDGGLECLQGLAADVSAAMEHEAVTETLAAVEEDDARERVRAGIEETARSGAIWQIAHLHGDEAAASAMVELLTSGASGVRGTIPEALLYCSGVPDEARASLAQWIEDNPTAQGVPGWSDLLHLLRVVIEVNS